MNNEKPQIGVSACLLGQPVRFDGGHKRDSYINNVLAAHVDLHPLCPESEIGLGTPRPALQLRQQGDSVHMVVSRAPQQDITEKMNRYAENKVESMADLDGVIFKKNSPSCGMERVAVVVNDHGHRRKSAAGIFANTFMTRWPLIPVEEEGRLHDMGLRGNFLERVYAYRRWKAIENADKNVQGFIQFHAAHKLMLMARGHHYYGELGRIVAGVTRNNLLERRQQYIHRFMTIMTILPKPGRHMNVLQHIMGYFKTVLSHDDKQELLQLFEDYSVQLLPLNTPLALLRHHLRRHPHDYIRAQHYLAPYPASLTQGSWA